ncbi:MAG: transcription termination factor Rho [Puniceicoccaceae bacterium 5H]|nr:MAG: transcription termination factor Rho [Puniceicoccaceae bacterium 5H]
MDERSETLPSAEVSPAETTPKKAAKKATRKRAAKKTARKTAAADAVSSTQLELTDEAGPAPEAKPAAKKVARKKRVARKVAKDREEADQGSIFEGEAPKKPADEGAPKAPAAPSLIKPPVTKEAVPTSYSSDHDDWQERQAAQEAKEASASETAEKPDKGNQKPSRDQDRGGDRERDQGRGDKPRKQFDRNDRWQDNKPQGGGQGHQNGHGNRPDNNGKGGKNFQKGGKGNNQRGQQNGGGKNFGGKQGKFDKKGGGKQQQKQQQRQSRGKQQKRANANFFGAEETFTIQIGELDSLPLLRHPDRMSELAADFRRGEGGPVNLNVLLKQTLPQLMAMASDEFDINPDNNPSRQELLTQIMWRAWQQKWALEVEGVVETSEEGYGLIVYEHESYRIKPLNAFISRTLMKKYALQRGSVVKAQLHPPRFSLPDDALEQLRDTGRVIEEEELERSDARDPSVPSGEAIPDGWEDDIAEQAMEALFPIADYVPSIDADEESCPYVLEITSVMGHPAEEGRQLTPFEDLIPYYPTERIILENEEAKKWDNFSLRIVDLLTPIGLGQRGLIVAPPRTGKTVLQQGIANSILKNMPKAHLIVLLIDERPEEVTDFRRQIKSGEVIASTFDEMPENHVHCAEMVIEKARRMVEDGQDVIILLDSITRLARAYNALAANSGKILSGGVEATALQKPKRFFGSARNIEGGGSLTIIGTALVETGSRMDEVIFEEFKGTGNMELHLDRQLSDKRVFPAIDMNKSGTRKEELLYHPDEMAKVHSLRRAMKGVPGTDAMEMLIGRIKKTQTNIQFLMGING